MTSDNSRCDDARADDTAASSPSRCNCGARAILKLAETMSRGGVRRGDDLVLSVRWLCEDCWYALVDGTKARLAAMEAEDD